MECIHSRTQHGTHTHTQTHTYITSTKSICGAELSDKRLSFFIHWSHSGVQFLHFRSLLILFGLLLHFLPFAYAEMSNTIDSFINKINRYRKSIDSLMYRLNCWSYHSFVWIWWRFLCHFSFFYFFCRSAFYWCAIRYGNYFNYHSLVWTSPSFCIKFFEKLRNQWTLSISIQWNLDLWTLPRRNTFFFSAFMNTRKSRR